MEHQKISPFRSSKPIKDIAVKPLQNSQIQNLVQKDSSLRNLRDDKDLLTLKATQNNITNMNNSLIKENELLKELNNSYIEQIEQLKTTLFQSQKKIKENEKLKQDTLIQGEIQGEHVKKLNKALNEKQQEIEKLSDEIIQLKQLEEENNILQNDLQEITRQYEDYQKENVNILKLMKRQVLNAKDEVENVNRSIEEKNFKLQEKQQIVKKLEKQLSHKDAEVEKVNESIRISMESQLEEKLEWENQVQDLNKKINFQSVKIDEQQKIIEELSQQVQGYQKNQDCNFEDIRVQIEQQLTNKFIQEKACFERMIWQAQNKIAEMENEVNVFQQQHSQNKCERDEMFKELTQIKGQLKLQQQLEANIKHLTQENDRLRQIQDQKMQENNYFRNQSSSFEQLKVYTIEVEKKLNTALQENEKLKQILVERCKNSW